jgi:transcriptional regulator NrdR family protein
VWLVDEREISASGMMIEKFGCRRMCVGCSWNFVTSLTTQSGHLQVLKKENLRCLHASPCTTNQQANKRLSLFPSGYFIIYYALVLW